MYHFTRPNANKFLYYLIRNKPHTLVDLIFEPLTHLGVMAEVLRNVHALIKIIYLIL